MPVQVSYPGVYVQEIPSGTRTITGVSTSVALFIGMAEQGPMGEPMRTLSYTEFERTYGTTNSLGELHDQVRQFFLNGGSTAWVIRIATGSSPSKVKLLSESGGEVLELEARSHGLVGQSIRAQVDYDTAEPEQTFNMRIEQVGLDPQGVSTVVASELFKNLTMDPNHGRYVVDVLEQQSKLVRATALDDADPIAAYSLWGVYEAAANVAVLNASYVGTGSFQISVDGSPFVTVTLVTEEIVNAAAVEAAINNALLPTGKSVDVAQESFTGGSRHLWKLTSGSGGVIAYAPGTSNDISVAMKMGTVNGGIDVGGWAAARPAPNGIFGRLIVGTFATFTTNFGGLLGLGIGDLDEFAITDSLSSAAVSPAPSLPTATATSLTSVRTLLNSLATVINADADLPWSASVHGYRLVVMPTFGLNSADYTAFAATSVTAIDGDYLWGNDTGNTRWYELGGFTTTRGSFQDGTAPGSNGSSPDATAYGNAYTTASRDIDLFNILVLPRDYTKSEGARIDLWGAASAFAKSERAVLLVDPPPSWADSSDVSDNITDLRTGVVTDHSAVYWPRIKIAKNGLLTTIDPSGTIAGIMARIDTSRGVWKAAAGLEATMIGVRGVEHGMNDADNGVLNPRAVNAIRSLPSGIVSWGARTMVGFDNSGNDDYKYLPVRRLALYIAESLYRGLQWAVFEPNDEPLWRELRQSAGAFMNNLFRLGAFAGETARNAYFVKVDRETTTQNDINLGIVNVVIGFAPLKPAEFVVLTIQQQAGEVQV
jgi:phage tail sheath protein FI